MKFTDLQKYKHDTIAKFQTLQSLVEMINEENLKDHESLEILLAADEVYASMSKASQKLIEILHKDRI